MLFMVQGFKQASDQHLLVNADFGVFKVSSVKSIVSNIDTLLSLKKPCDLLNWPS